MSEDELKRKMEFIVEQQAQFASDIQRITAKQENLTEAMITVVGMVGKLSTAHEQLASKVDALADFQKATDERLKATDDRVNVLIDVVEKYFSDRRNGHDRGEAKP